MEEKKISFFSGKILAGIIIIAIGIILLLGTLGLNMDINIGDFWPVILIAIGIKIMATHTSSKDIFWGLFLFILGIMFQLRRLDIFYFTFHDIWPFILIYIGIQIILSGGKKHHHDFGSRHKKITEEDSEGNKINISAILGGGEYRYSNKKLKGGKISAIMGGCEIDLRDSDFEGEEMIINVLALMGGIEIMVPQNWNVILEATPILGSIENKTKTLNGTKKELFITGEAIMGGVEIKN